ncbi:MAG: hypothetical protein HOO87_04330 [Methyloglobulus sp.]|nr:hypothetical protein [Methyloglobulus sp.]
MKPSAFVYVALACEAKPFIEYFRLKKDQSIACFAVYVNDDICLTITGVGKIAMAAGVAYTQALFASAQQPVMLNVGIAGHRSEEIGNLLLIDKLEDCDTGRRFYPPLIFTSPCPTRGLQTHAKPQTRYHPTHLCDMEASAFYETAIRFSTGELIQCLKVVSDNETSLAQNISPQWVTRLIGAQLHTIECILAELTKLAGLLSSPELPEFNSLVSCYHFSATEKIQLKKLLSRRALVKGRDSLEFDDATAQNGKELLRLLEKQLERMAFYL